MPPPSDSASHEGQVSGHPAAGTTAARASSWKILGRGPRQGVAPSRRAGAHLLDRAGGVECPAEGEGADAAAWCPVPLHAIGAQGSARIGKIGDRGRHRGPDPAVAVVIVDVGFDRGALGVAPLQLEPGRGAVHSVRAGKGDVGEPVVCLPDLAADPGPRHGVLRRDLKVQTARAGRPYFAACPYCCAYRSGVQS